MITTASRDDLPLLRDLLIRANDAPYDIAPVVEEKCFGPGVSGEPVVRVARENGEMQGLSVTCGNYLRILAVDGAHRRRGMGSALLRDAEDRGVSVIAAEPGNYFTPGVAERDRETVRFFANRSYRPSVTTQNLETDQLPAGEPATATGRDRERVLAFIENTFGDAWRFESERAAALYFIEEEGRVVGFSACEANNRGLGTFGPTGVAPGARGRGHGRTLLLAALAGLRRLGHHRAIIPWADALDFYARSCGARVTERFVILRR